MYRRPDLLYEKQIMINGKKKAFRGHSPQEVTRKILEYRGEIEKGRLFQEVAEEWKERHFEAIEYNTRKSYIAPYNRLVEKFREIYINKIKPNDINSFLGQFSRRGYSQKTVRNQLLVTNLIFSSAVVDGYIESNPTEYIAVPKNLPKSKRDMPKDEFLELVKTNYNKPFGLLAYFLLYTGCRIGEALAIQYKDIDKENKIIRITKSVYHENSTPHLKTPKTAAGTRDIILLDILAAKLPDGREDDYLFPGQDNRLMTYSELKKGWKCFCEEIGACEYKIVTEGDKRKHRRPALLLTPHQLRHGFATILFEAGINEKDAQELLGHSSISVTRDTYTHIRKSRKEKTAEILNKFTENTQ